MVTTAIRQIWMTHHSSIYRVLQVPGDKPQRLTTESAEVELKQLSLQTQLSQRQQELAGLMWQSSKTCTRKMQMAQQSLPVSCTKCPGAQPF